MTTIYTIELEHFKYYVGRFDVPSKRILQYLYEEGPHWTKTHKPLKVLTKIKGDAFDEEKYTLLAMESYGVDNVRGGSYCNSQLTQHDTDKALQTIRSINGSCFNCGEKGHFAKDCKYNDEDDDYCVACNNTGYGYWGDDCSGSCLQCCCIDCGKNFNICPCEYCKLCNGLLRSNEIHTCNNT